MPNEDERRIAAWAAYARRNGYASHDLTYFRECFEAGWRVALDDVRAQEPV